MRHAVSEIRHRNPDIVGTIHPLAHAFLHGLDRFKNAFENSFKQGGSMSTEASFQPDRNCDSIRRADRFSLLIDGPDCFRVLREAITRAVSIPRRDIDSRIKTDGRRCRRRVCAMRKRPRLYILAWDFAMLDAFERGGCRPARWDGVRIGVAFQMDGKHSMGGSHHRKMIVIDDTLAFVGRPVFSKPTGKAGRS